VNKKITSISDSSWWDVKEYSMHMNGRPADPMLALLKEE
jgi:hypothetical protein